LGPGNLYLLRSCWLLILDTLAENWNIRCMLKSYDYPHCNVCVKRFVIG
jgi:hypothetical protein